MRNFSAYEKAISLPPFEARQALVGTGAEKVLLLAQNEWKADTYSTTGLIYDIELLILGSDGTVLARTTREGKDDLGKVHGTHLPIPVRLYRSRFEVS